MGKKFKCKLIEGVLEGTVAEDDLCGFMCFVVGVISMFLVVGAIATLIVLGVDNRHSFGSLSSSHKVKPLSSRVMQSLTNSVTMYTEILDDTPGSLDKELDLLVLVHSLPQDSASREAIRKTWMKTTLSLVEVLFVVPAAGVAELETIKNESKTHQDMIVFLSGPKIPESETLLLEYVWAMRSRKFAYLMKTRDSMYVRLDVLMKEVVKNLNDAKSNAYLGYFQGQQKPGEKSTKYNEPEWFLCDYFIRFAHSGGYILSRELVHRLYTQASVLYPYNNEDVALGTWLSPYDDVDWTHNIRFNTEVGKSRGCRNNFIVFPSSDMVAQHDRLQNGGSLCLVEENLVQTYNYNFKTSPSKCCTAVKFD